MKIKNLPKEIYLVLGDINDVSDDDNLDFEELSEVTWCDHKAFDNDIKYVLDEGWHDLRKNPDDLPKTDEEKLFQIERTEYPIRGYISDNCKFVYNNDISIIGDTVKIQKVIAWREIPKFEEE